MWRYHEDENLDDETHDLIHIIGNLELLKRKTGMSEEELNEMEKELKHGLKTDKGREELVKDYKLPIEDLQELRHHLRFRRRFYKELRKDAEKELESSKEMAQNELKEINKSEENPNN